MIWRQAETRCARRYSSFKALLLGFVVTFFPVFDVPVFWPILLMYWLVLLFVTMKRQIKHMIKYRYIPFSIGKKVGRHLPPLGMLHLALQHCRCKWPCPIASWMHPFVCDEMLDLQEHPL
jgi:hypothetical protein